MSRLSMLVERAENSPNSQQIFDTKAFQRDFAELMRRSQALYDNLRLYNEQLQSAEELVQ